MFCQKKPYTTLDNQNCPKLSTTLSTMVFSCPNQEATLVHSHKFTSVGPSRLTGQVTHELTTVDLAMKLHYLKFIYYFSSEAFSGVKIKDYTSTDIFTWCNRYYMTSGRIRKTESGRPYVKCNDCGVRLVEALSETTLDDWLKVKNSSMEKMLVYDKVIGPEIEFSPLVYIQLTTFKCGGVSFGLSWPHFLGDAFTVTEYMDALGQIMATQKVKDLDTNIQMQANPNLSQSPPKDPLSLKRIEPVGDQWKITNICKMEMFSFQLSAKQICYIQPKVGGNFGKSIPPFESICAIVWKSVAKTRSGYEPKVVTICKKGAKRDKTKILGCNQAIGVVQAISPVAGASLNEIGEWVCNQNVDDLTNIEEAVEKEQGLSDFIFYGANLTFLDMGASNIYGFEIQGEKPICASCYIDGVGEEGVVLVIPDGKGGKVVTLIMPEIEVSELKMELEREFGMA